MKKEIKYIDGDKVTIYHEPCDYLEDDLPDELDFSQLIEIPNPMKKKVMLDPDISRYFSSSKQVNDYLRRQIKLLRNTVKSKHKKTEEIS